MGIKTEWALNVLPKKPARAEFDVVRLLSMDGKVSGPQGVALEGIVIRMLPGARYTTPDAEGNFTFYNLRAGTYTLAVDEKTLPEFGVLNRTEPLTIAVHAGARPQPATFAFEVHRPEKVVRKVAIAQPAASPAQVQPAEVSKPQVMPQPEPASPKPASIPAATAAQKHQSGRHLIEAGKYHEAIDALNEAILLKPDFALAYNARGYAWLRLHNYAAAIKDLNEAIRLNPNYENAYVMRGMSKRAAGDPSGAAADLRQAEKLHH